MGTIVVLIFCWFVVQHPALLALTKAILLVMGVITTYIFWKIGFLTVFGETLIMIPVNFFLGVFGILAALLGAK